MRRTVLGAILLAAGRNLEVSANVFNLLNGGEYSEYARTGPNRIYNPASYLTYTNPQTPPRAAARGRGQVLTRRSG